MSRFLTFLCHRNEKEQGNGSEGSWCSEILATVYMGCPREHGERILRLNEAKIPVI